MKRLALLTVLLAGCAEANRNPVPEPSVVQVPAFEWRVETQAGLEAAYRDFGMPLERRDRLSGFVGQTADGRWVVYTRAPRRVDDGPTLALGHEVLHIVSGDYHQ